MIAVTLDVPIPFSMISVCCNTGPVSDPIHQLPEDGAPGLVTVSVENRIDVGDFLQDGIQMNRIAVSSSFLFL